MQLWLRCTAVMMCLLSTFVGCLKTGTKVKAPAYIKSSERLPLIRTVLIEEKRLDTIFQVSYGHFLPGHGALITVNGLNDTLFLNRQGRVLARHTDPDETITHRVIPYKGGSAFFTEYAVIGTHPLALLDNKNHPIWRSEFQGKDPDDVSKTAVGDVDGDAQPEFAVLSFNGLLYLLDTDGKLRWKVQEKSNEPDGMFIADLSIVDTNGDNMQEVVTCTYIFETEPKFGQMLTMRDKAGQIMGTAKFPRGFSVEAFTPWPDMHATQHVVGTQNDQGVAVYDTAGQQKQLYPCPDYGIIKNAMPVTFRPGQRPYFAVSMYIGGKDKKDQTRLLIFDQNRAMVYDETLNGFSRALLAIPSATPGAEDLLIGIDHTLHKLSLTAKEATK